MLPTRTELEAERARRSLASFVRLAWPQLEPATPFVPGFHLDLICAALEAVTRGEIRRLLINIPPRHGKSTVTSVLWPAWVWTREPAKRFLCASYALPLAVRDTTRSRRLLESPWYQARWGRAFRLTDDQNTKSRLENDRSGARIATSVGGATTGEGGDIVIIDDPHKINEAASTPIRETVLDWFDGTISTRLNDPAKGAIVIIGQRLHEADLFGHLLDSGGWTHLCLPAEYEPEHPFLCPDDPRREPGELLWPERFDDAQVTELKRTLGSFGAAGQLQQRPAPAGGGMFERRWWRWYDPAELPPLERIVQAWDLTFSAGPGSDYVVGQAWGKSGPNVYLLRSVRERLSFTETIRAIRSMTEILNAEFGFFGHAILVEKAANAAAAIDVLSREIPAIRPVQPRGGKIERASAISPLVEGGNVYLPGRANAEGSGYDLARTLSWVQDFVEEAASAPGGAYWDQIDAMGYALAELARPQPRLRVLAQSPRARW